MSEVTFIGGARVKEDFDRLKLKDLPRIAFAGRSNVGKSSLLNELVRKKIARVSQSPGKTQEINFFEWKKRYLVDLPGYGYAKVSHTLRELWGKEIQRWILEDSNLTLLILLVDGYIGIQKTDAQMMQFLQHEGIPFIVAFTKVDKHKSKNKRVVAEKQLEKSVKELGVTEFLFVSVYQAESIAALSRKVLSYDSN